MKKRQIYSKIRVRENERGAKSEGARKLEARKLKVRNLKGRAFNGSKVLLVSIIVVRYKCSLSRNVQSMDMIASLQDECTKAGFSKVCMYFLWI